MLIAIIIVLCVLLIIIKLYSPNNQCRRHIGHPEQYASYAQPAKTTPDTYHPVAEVPIKIGGYVNNRPSALTDTRPQLETERNGISITNGKANRVLWGFDSGIKAGSQKYPKFPTATGNLEHSDDTSLEDSIMYAHTTPQTSNVLLDYPNTPDEFVNYTFEIPNRLSNIAPRTETIDGESEYKKYISSVINIDDTDGRIATSNLNRGFRVIQARALSAQSKVEKFRPFYEQQLRERTCWLNVDDPIM